MNSVNEYIVCSAIHYQNGKRYRFQPINIDSGIVITGLQHNHCMMILLAFLGTEYSIFSSSEDVKGFLTSKNRFVNRQEAYRIALAQGQLLYASQDLVSEGSLSSEDIFHLGRGYSGQSNV